MPLVSIIIPTRNRQEYVLCAVRVALAHLSDVEIVVHDNSDDVRLHSKLRQFLPQDERLKYFHVSEVLSVVENFELALAHASGDYVIFLGDDDCIGPGIERIAKWCVATGVDAVVPYVNAFNAVYYWPGIHSRFFGKRYEGMLHIRSFSSKVRYLEPLQSLKDAARNLGGGLGELPRAYHGMVSRSLIERVIQSHGHFFGGVSPDIYSATLLAVHCRKAVHFDFPFILPGASPKSTAGAGAAKKDRGALDAVEHTARFRSNLAWDERIPRFYSPYNVWAASLILALKQVNLSDDIVLGFGRLYARVIADRRWKTLAQPGVKIKRSTVIEVLKGLAGELADIWWRVYDKLLIALGSRQRLTLGPYATIEEAFDHLQEVAALEGFDQGGSK